MVNWDNYSNFSKYEFDCKETGKNEMEPEFLDKLQELRTLLGKPIIITSGYRAPEHSIEAVKDSPGYHTKGIAADISCWGTDAYDIARLAFQLGFTGIRFSQRKGKPWFIHLDQRPINERHIGSY